MTAGRCTKLLLAMLLTLATVSFAAGARGPVAAATAAGAPLHMLSLGDSVAAGEDLCATAYPGAEPCGNAAQCAASSACNGQDGCAAPSNWVYPCTGPGRMPPCELSPGCTASPAISYPADLAASLARTLHAPVLLRNFACSGFTTADFGTARSGQSTPFGTPGQPSCGVVQRAGESEFDALTVDGKSTADLITITIGANDFIHFAEQNPLCVVQGWPPPGICGTLYDLVKDALGIRLLVILAAARDTGKTVRVTGYYQPFPQSCPSGTDPLVCKARSNVDSAVVELDGIIQGDVAAIFGSAAPYYVDLEPAFNGHEWGTASTYITPMESCSDPANALLCAFIPGIHPNGAGQAQIAARLAASLPAGFGERR